MSNRQIEAILRVSSKLGSMTALTTLQQKLAAVNRQTEAYNRVNNRNFQTTLSRMSAYTGLTALGVGLAVKGTYGHFAEVERRLNRIAINAGEGKEVVAGMVKTINQASQDYAVSQDDVTAGLESLVAAGRSAKDAMTFLPSVVATAQAAGAEIADIATTADAVSTSFGLAGDKMQGAFDILVEAGKLGKFELKDMAQYLPSLAPAFASLGYEGAEGVSKLAAMLQVVRMRTGSASEAATSLQNVFQKMESEETVKKFAKFGIDLRKELTRARKEGRDLVEVFLDLTRKATGGDMSKIPQLFTDAEFQKAMRALLMGGDAMDEFVAALRRADGSTLRALGQVLDDNKAKIDRMKASWEEFKTAFGGAVAPVIGGALDAMSEGISANQAIATALKKRGMSYWEIQSWFAQHEFDVEGKREMAAEGGWRDPKSRIAEKGTRSVSPELPSRRQEGETSPPGVPVPTPRPDPNIILPEVRYDRFPPIGKGYVEVLADDENKDFQKLSHAERRATLAARSPEATGDASYDEFLRAASQGGADIADGADKAGQSLEQAGTSAGSAMEDGATAMRTAASTIEAAAAKLLSAVASIPRTITVNTGGGVSADVGRSNGGVKAGPR